MLKNRLSAVFTPAVIISSALLFGGCLSIFPGARNSGEDADHIVTIGKSKTTTIEAALSSSGTYSIIYSYIDSYWLLAESLTVEASGSTKTLYSPDPVRVENGRGDYMETDRMEVPRSLFENLLESENPTIFLKGKQGTVIIEMGRDSMDRLADFLAWGKKEFPGS